jgi:hypothetical protein
MGAVISSVQGTLILGVLLAGLYAAYRAALPRPLPDIPYNRDAAHKLLGDVPEMLAYVMRTKRVFVSRQHIQHRRSVRLTNNGSAG